MDLEQTLTNDEAVRELLGLLKQNGMKEQANDVFELCSYVDSLENKMEQLTEQMSKMQQQIKEMKEDTLVNHAKAAIKEAQDNLNKTYHQAKDKIFEVKENVKTTARSIVAEAKIKGRAALLRVTEFTRIKPALVSIRESVKHAIKSTDRNIAKVALLGKGMREAGHVIANTFRTFADKPELDYSKDEKKHEFTNAIIKPMQLTKKLLVSMNLRLDGSIDKLDNLALDVQIDKEQKEKAQEKVTVDDSKDVLEETTVDKATDNIIDMSEAELIPMVAEKKEYQYNADAFEARGNEAVATKDSGKEIVSKQAEKSR